MIDNKTTHLQLPLPNAANALADDVERIVTSLTMLDSAVTAPVDWLDVTGKPTTLAGYGITDAASSGHTHTFASLTSKPTTLAGYGITDAASSGHTHTVDALSNVSISGKATNDVLQWNGSAWVNKTLAGAGIQPAGSYVMTSGGSMTGGLTLNADPSTNLQAATKQYVDAVLPSQSGNTGKVLVTNGTTPIWSTPASVALPSQTGNAGKVLTTNGTDASWSDTPVTAYTFAMLESGAI